MECKMYNKITFQIYSKVGLEIVLFWIYICYNRLINVFFKKSVTKNPGLCN